MFIKHQYDGDEVSDAFGVAMLYHFMWGGGSKCGEDFTYMYVML